MNSYQPPQQRAFPAALLRKQKEYLMNEITRNRKTHAHRRRSLVLRFAVALAVVTAIVVGVSVIGDGGPLRPLTMPQAVAAITPGAEEVVHIKITGTDVDGNTLTDETWTYYPADRTMDNPTPDKYRGIRQRGDRGAEEEALDGRRGLRQVYDSNTDTIFETKVDTAVDPEAVTMRLDELADYQQLINEILAIEVAHADGHEKVDGRDAVRILWDREFPSGKLLEKQTLYLVDAKTGAPLELRITEAGKTRTVHFDVYEKLPGTPENLALLDLRTAHPEATVSTDAAAFQQFTAATLPAEQMLPRTATATGEVLHTKETVVDNTMPYLAEEAWFYTPYDDTPGIRRTIGLMGDVPCETTTDGIRGVIQYYDSSTNTIFERQEDSTESEMTRAKMTGRVSIPELIRESLSSGKARVDGHEQVDGRDAVRVIEGQADAPPGGLPYLYCMYLVDAQTGFPVEIRIVDTPRNSVTHFDLYEKLPGTPNNLALLDLRVAHPGATVNTDPAAYEQFTAKLFAAQQVLMEQALERHNKETERQYLEGQQSDGQAVPGD